MILFGCVLVLISVVLIVLAWRGRVIERGVFCRACSFNLAGLPEASESKCPECGNSIQGDANRRSTLRSKSVAGVLRGLVLLVAGGGLIGVGSSGMKSAFYAKLPDSIIVPLVTLGSDDALEELIPRLTRPQMMSDQYWDRIIKHALDVQADPLAPWDPRIGEILANAWVFDRFSDEQLVSYLDHAIETEIIIRDRVQQGSNGIRCTVDVYSNRIHATNPMTSGTSLDIGLISTHIEGDRTRYSNNHEIQNSLGSFGINVPALNSSWELGGHLRIENSQGKIEYDVGTKVQVTVEFELQLVDTQTREESLYKKMIVHEQVEVISKNEPIVGTVVDDKLAQHMCKNFQVSKIYAVNEMSEDHQSWTPILGFSSFSKQGFPVAIALRTYLVVDGQEYEIDRFVQKQSGGGAVGSSFTWNADPENSGKFENAQQVLRRIHETGQVDIVYRTDPTIAEGSPAINEVLDLELVFRDVPVVGVESHGMIWQSLTNPEWQEAVCDD